MVTDHHQIALMAVTGSRADWGLLTSPLALLRDDPTFKLILVVTGQHLTPQSKASLTEIGADGFAVNAKIDLCQRDTTVAGVAQGLAVAIAGFTDLFVRQRPDMLIVLGDRFEIFGAVQAALLTRIPVAHLCGGDVTEGIQHMVRYRTAYHLLGSLPDISGATVPDGTEITGLAEA